MYTLRTHLNDVGLSPESQEAHYRLIEAISNELIECGLIKGTSICQLDLVLTNRSNGLLE